MSTISIFYDNTPTKNFRFLTRNDFNSWFNSQSPDNVLMDNDVNPYSSWFDCELSSQILYKIKYIHITNSNITSFFAFVDRVEDNNFLKSTFRVYFTVDWWSTLQFYDNNSDSLLSHIRGDVIRAHVNDWKKNDDETISPDLSYTDNVLEENVVSWHTHSWVLTESVLSEYNEIGADVNVQFVHIIFRRDLSSNETPCIIQKYPQYVPTPFGYGIIPIINGKFISWSQQLGSSWHNTDILDRVFTTLSGDRIVAMFVANTCGIKWNLVQQDNSYAIIFNLSGTDYTKVVDFPIDTSETTSASCITFAEIPATEYPNTSIVTESITPFSDTKINISDINLSWFNNKGMVKAISEPYVIWGILGQKTGLILHPQYMLSSDTVSILNSPNFGSQYVIVKDNSYSGISQTYWIQGDNTFTVFTEQNWIDEKIGRYNAFSSVLQPIISGAKNEINYKYGTVNALSEGDFIGASKGLETQNINRFETMWNVAGGVLNSIQILRELGLGGSVQISPNYEGSTIYSSSLRAITMYPQYDNNWSEIKQHLRLYGYTTYLEPCDILTKHRRVKYNYIKCSYCYFDNFISPTTSETYLQLNDNVKNSILQMFIDGVFLFRHTDVTDDFNFNVINMQEGIT